MLQGLILASKNLPKRKNHLRCKQFNRRLRNLDNRLDLWPKLLNKKFGNLVQDQGPRLLPLSTFKNNNLVRLRGQVSYQREVSVTLLHLRICCCKTKTKHKLWEKKLNQPQIQFWIKVLALVISTPLRLPWRDYVARITLIRNRTFYLPFWTTKKRKKNLEPLPEVLCRRVSLTMTFLPNLDSKWGNPCLWQRPI